MREESSAVLFYKTWRIPEKEPVDQTDAREARVRGLFWRREQEETMEHHERVHVAEPVTQTSEQKILWKKKPLHLHFDECVRACVCVRCLERNGGSGVTCWSCCEPPPSCPSELWTSCFVTENSMRVSRGRPRALPPAVLIQEQLFIGQTV